MDTQISKEVLMPLGIYQHYKGPLYLYLGAGKVFPTNPPATVRVLGKARHSETGDYYDVVAASNGSLYCHRAGTTSTEPHAIYVPLYAHTGPGMAIRPMSMFTEGVYTPGIGERPRFKFIAEVISPELQQPYLPVHLTTDTVVGRLDRLLSEFLLLCERPDLDEADFQTLKHHGDDLIGVGRKGLALLRNRIDNAERAKLNAADRSLVSVLFNGQGDFVSFGDQDTREPTGCYIRQVPRHQLGEIVAGRLRIYPDGREERPHR